MPKQNFNEDNELPNYDKLDVITLQEMASEKFETYFKTKNEISSSERKKLMQEYNELAKLVNKKSGFHGLITLTPSTQVVIAPERIKEKKEQTIAAPKPAGGKIAEILGLWERGLSKKAIIENYGFNKSTVNRQISEYEKRKQQSAS